MKLFYSVSFTKSLIKMWLYQTPTLTSLKKKKKKNPKNPKPNHPKSQLHYQQTTGFA